jgi:hypothetical protein
MVYGVSLLGFFTAQFFKSFDSILKFQPGMLCDTITSPWCDLASSKNLSD